MLNNLTDAQKEAVANADAHLNNVALPLYTEVVEENQRALAHVMKARQHSQEVDHVTRTLLERTKVYVDDGELKDAKRLLQSLIELYK